MHRTTVGSALTRWARSLAEPILLTQSQIARPFCAASQPEAVLQQLPESMGICEILLDRPKTRNAIGEYQLVC